MVVLTQQLQTYFLRTITSVNQLSMYGAVSDWCEELAQRIEDRSKGIGKPMAENTSGAMMAPTSVPASTNPLLTSDKALGNQLRQHLTEICKTLQMIVV